MFKNLLEYQKLDGKLLKLKQSVEKNPAKQTLNKVVVLVKDEQNKLLELETKAKSVISDYEKCKIDYDKAYKSFMELSSNANYSEEKINENLEELNKLVTSLTLLERSLSSQAELVTSIIKNFETCRNNIVTYRQKYKESKTNVEEYESSVRPQIEEIKKQMISMEKEIDKDLLSKYKHLRQDKIFPVLVPLNQNACGGCSMSVSSAHMNKLKSDGYLECEQCRRYIYTD